MPTERARRTPAQVGWIWAVYALLFVVSVPWYLPVGPLRLWLGLPYWVVVSVAAIAAVGVFTQIVVRRYWDDDDTDPPAVSGRCPA